MLDFKDKIAFITGGASGLGLAMAHSFSKRGAKIMLSDIDGEKLAAAEAELKAAGVDVASIICDVADAAAVQVAADATIERFGKVHIVANNAGVSFGGRPGHIPLEDWRWIVDINLMGVVHGVEIFTPLIQSHGEGGHFLNTGSMAGHGTNIGMAPYYATKFAVVGYSEAIRQELASSNIGVTCLCPAWVATNIHNTSFGKPSGRPTKEETVNTQAYKEMAQVINSGLSAGAVADWTAECMEANRLHVFTHPDFKPMLDGRAAALSADYQAIIDDGRFEGNKG